MMRALWRTCVTKSQKEVQPTITVSALLLWLSLTCCSALQAQQHSDPTEPNMAGVTDATGGLQYLLRNDDLVMLQVNVDRDKVTTSVITLDTTNSKVSDKPKSTEINSYISSGTFDPKYGVVASQAVGRMYNTKSDIVATLNAIDNGFGNQGTWLFTLLDPLTGFKEAIPLNLEVVAHGTVFTSVVMGDFNGDKLVDPLIYYASEDPDHKNVSWGMTVFTAADPNKEAAPTQGPALFQQGEPIPMPGSIVVGDFNGDGRDEIAAMLNDLQTIVFFSVDPKTLKIEETNRIKLPDLTMASGQVAITSGHFRNLSPGVTNADLVVFGQIDRYHGKQADNGYSVIPILNTLDYDQNGLPNGKFTPSVVQQTGQQIDASADTPYFRFNDKHGSFGALAQAAALAHWPQQVAEQLVLGIKTTEGASYIEIGSFVQDKTLNTFDWESETERESGFGGDFLQNMWVGNFDNLKGDTTEHNAALQIETYELLLNAFTGQTEPHIYIFDVNVPSPFVIPAVKKTDWLKQKSDNTSGIPSVAGPGAAPRMDILAPGDIQGRSLRLGAPTIARITSQIQPDVVLAIPPMHVDYIAPLDATLASHNPCTDKTGNTPCVINISVRPDLPPASSTVAFATTYVFDDSQKSTNKQASTTSWGVSVKQKIGETATFNDGLENASESLQDTTKFGYENTVKDKYNTYTGTDSNLTVTTGFSDHLLWTDRELNVYYYPVLGCDPDTRNCAKDGKNSEATYVEFSVPDQIKYYNQDSNTQDWYQPVHEAGNLLSYPWTTSQMESRFTGRVVPLTTNPTCLSLSSGGSNSSSTTWSQGSTSNHSSGSTNSFSNELSLSYSEGVGVEGADGADFNYSLDVGINTSLDTLNESISSTSSSKGITITEPDFGYSSGGNGDYGFTQFIFGLQNKTNPASENACMNGQTPSDKYPFCIGVQDPDAKRQVGIGGVGPLFTGYTATTNTSCSGTSGNNSWWQSVYTKPDVALNHPRRWYWDSDAQKVSFILANDTPNPVDNDFYAMKGFFVTRQSAGKFANLTLPQSPNLGVVSASDKLTLTTRVYNYSLVSITTPVQVRFYGQLYCHTKSESSCTDWKTKAACTTLGTLCGDSFAIGDPTSISGIGGFNSDPGNTTEPTNWQLASVDFDPANYPATAGGNLHMVFWVVVWMQDGSGKLVAEMPGHGLTAIPGSNLTQITQVATEEYSNNVGMYPLRQYFQILPPNVPPAATQSGGSLQSVAVSVNPQVSLGKRSKIEATLHAAGAQLQSVNVVYYDGDPAKNGKLIDVQKIASMNPNAGYYHRAFFDPTPCGPHTIYVRAWTLNSSISQASATTNVTIQPVDFVQSMIASVQAANITNAQLRTDLINTLNIALQSFQQGQTPAGNAALGTYLQQLATANGISPDNANRLKGQGGVVFGCGSSGFSLSALPSSSTVPAGNATSYAIGITPSGGFNSAVALTCSGAPQGATCAFSSQSVTLDGVNQSIVTVTVTTAPRSPSAAGMIGGLPSSHAGKLKWLLMLLAALLAIAILQRGRLRYSILGCVVLMMLSISGCGGGGGGNSSKGTPSGVYPLKIQGASGSTNQTTLLSLIVQ